MTRYTFKLNIDYRTQITPPPHHFLKELHLSQLTSCSSVTTSPPFELGVGVCSPDILHTGQLSEEETTRLWKLKTYDLMAGYITRATDSIA